MRFFVKNKTILLMKIGEPSRDRTFWFVAPQGFPSLFSTLETTLLESLVC
mgnify:CR=1 FL=1